MDYTSLDEITASIIEVIQNELDIYFPTATPKAEPQLLKKENGIGFYLFHVSENSHYKNYPAPGMDNPPVKFTPMALNLFYQLSPNWDHDDETKEALQEQLLMSIAMKALHDNAVLKTTSTGKNIDIKITLQTLTPSESVQYWAASESSVRLSAYYEVSVVFLEPEKTKSYASRVLSYGNYIFVQGAPQITGSQSILEYTLPGEHTPRQVKIQPAQAPVGKIVSFFGTGFKAVGMKLLLISPLWQKPAEVGVIRISENQLDMTVQSTATLQGSPTVVDIIPGLYAARVSITEQKTLPNGTVKEFNHLSNQFPFSVMPKIILPAVGSRSFAVTGSIFVHTDLKSGDVQVYVGETSLTLHTDTLSQPNPGEFKITAFDTMLVNVPTDIQGTSIPIRILIRGIESAPNWINIP